MKEKAKTLGERLTAQARRCFVGREAELAVLDELLCPDGALVVHVHGIPGAGKSALLEHFAGRAREAGAAVHSVDCRQIEPTEPGLLAELARLAGSESPALEAVAARFGAGSVVLLFDHYESFLLLDAWIRQTLLPSMPGEFRLVLASRQPPAPRWTTAPRWHGLFRSVALEALGRQPSLALLASAGVEGEEAETLVALAHGNPLALKLAAARAVDSLHLPDSAIHDVMQQLTALYLGEVVDETNRGLLRMTSVSRRITRSLLRALTPEDEARYDALAALPFVDAWRDGLRIHTAVREAMARALKASDPERYREARRRAWRQLRSELRAAPRADLWRTTADMLYLIENPVVREAFFPTGQQALAVEPAQAEDREAILALVREHDEPATAALAAWWEWLPGAFHAVRTARGEVVGFYVMCEARSVPPSLRARDALADAWCRHLEEQPLARGETALLLRRWLSAEAGEAPSPEQAASWLDVKRAYMVLRPALRRVYLTVRDLGAYAEAATRLGFVPLADHGAELGGAPYHGVMLDFGARSVDGWITRLVGEELGEQEESLVDRERQALTLDGEEVPLTPLEFKLATYLEERPGATATRDELLEEVWGYAVGSGSSNVVDAVVKSLRRKLGAEAERVETVRGFGYRWRAP